MCDFPLFSHVSLICLKIYEQNNTVFSHCVIMFKISLNILRNKHNNLCIIIHLYLCIINFIKIFITRDIKLNI